MAKKNQKERFKVRRPCVAKIRQLVQLNYFNKYKLFYWCCPPDQGSLTMPQKMACKLDGYEKGVFDMQITAATKEKYYTWLIEFKYKEKGYKNGYTKEQQLVADSSIETPLEKNVLKIYNVDEFLEFIEGIKTPP